MPAVPEVVHRLVLLRHAKSAWPHGVPDHERPLAGKGRRNAGAAGHWFVSEGPRPDLVLVSDAERAQQTWEVVRQSFAQPPRVTVEPDLYDASVADVVTVVRAVPETVRTLVLVGHEPAMSGVTLALAGPDSEPGAVEAVDRKFPTSAVAVLALFGPWAQLGARQARLETFTVPRAATKA